MDREDPTADQLQEQGGTNARQRSVLVVGGGLIGLSCAWYLNRDGHRVTVLERGVVGGGASRGNAGLVCPALADPLPAPGVIRHALGGLLRPDSPLFVHPRALPRMTGFLVRFMASTSARRYRRGVTALARLGDATFDLFDELVEAGAVPPMGRQGYLMGFASHHAALEAHAVQEALARAGVGTSPGPVLAGRELAAVEPSLAEAVRFGFLQPDERWIDPSAMVDGLAVALRTAGVVVVEGADAAAIERTGAEVAVRTPGGTHRAEAVVIAAGAWSARLARSLRVRLPIVPGKGYSFFVPTTQVPGRPVYLADAHVVATPIDGRLRIAGTMEFDGTYEGMNRRRIDAMVRAARGSLVGVDWSELSDEWVAPRPMTPDGLPLIGEIPGQPGIYLASGHNMLGLTLAPVTGRAIADLVTGGRAPVHLAPFAPGRFRRGP
jgi:D-amino-acid dehydrogenase